MNERQSVPADPYDPDKNYSLNAPKSWRQMIKYWGPGMVVTASVVGSGELIATTGLGAKAGFIAMWIVLLSCLLKISIQLMIGRYAIYKGQTTLRFFNELPGPRLRVNWFIWLLLVVLLFVTFNQGAILGAIAMVLTILFPGVGVTPWAIATIVVVVLVLRKGYYSQIERMSLLMVAAFSMATLTCVSLIQTTGYKVSADQFISGLQFGLPDQGLGLAFAILGITGIGTTEIIFYPYWCIEKGYARSVGPYENTDVWYRRAKGWIRVMDWDAVWSMVVYTLLTLAFFILGASVLHAQGLIPEGMAMIETLSKMYTQVLGNWAFILFLTGAFFALFSTLFVSIAANSRLFIECFQLSGLIEIGDLQTRKTWIDRAVIALGIITISLYLVFELPLWMVMVGGSAQTLLLPAIVLGIVYIRITKFDRGLTPSYMFDALFYLSCITVLSITLFGVLYQLL